MKLLFLITIFFASNVNAQLTGSWQGKLGTDEYLEINIVQQGDKICGYSWDYDFANQQSYCKQNFTAEYDTETKTWFTYGTDFIEQGGGHVLMDMKFRIKSQQGKLLMYGVCRAKPFGGISLGDPEGIGLLRVSKKVTVMPASMKNCLAESAPVKEKTAPVKPKPVIKANPQKNPVAKDSIIKAPQIIHADTVTQVVPPVVVKPFNNILPGSTAGRTNKEVKHIIIHQKKLTLYVYDNGDVDGDSVSVFYNGKLMMNHMRLSEKPIVLNIDIDEKAKLHSIVLFAENLGTVPPNSALIIFTDKNGKRYELFAKSTLGENAELVFEYQPDE